MNHCILQASFFFLMEARTDLRLRVSQELLTKVLQKVVTREGQCGTWWDWALRNRSQSHKILPQMSHSLFCGMLESKHSLFNHKLWVIFTKPGCLVPGLGHTTYRDSISIFMKTWVSSGFRSHLTPLLHLRQRFPPSHISQARAKSCFRLVSRVLFYSVK